MRVTYALGADLGWVCADPGGGGRYPLNGRFVHATGATSIVVDFTDVPGFLTEWKLAEAGLRIRSFDATIQSGPNDRTLTGVSETLGTLSVAVDSRERTSLASLRRKAVR